MTDLNINIFEARRAKVASNMEKNSILLLSSSHIVSRNNDTTFPFRQDSNFYYLTGLEEPNSVLKVMAVQLFFADKRTPI
jgi:Xaa-Pro aminopeptidase